MLAGFGAVVWQRNVIRAHWWAWRLERTENPEDRGYYLACLSSVGPDASAALNRLASSPNAEMRLLAVYPLQRSTDSAGLSILAQLLRDRDGDVREAAGLALVFSDNPAALTILLGAAEESNAEVAANAIAACGRSDSPRAICCLENALQHSEARARAQAIESLAARISDNGEVLAAWPLSGIGPIDALVHGLKDQAEFAGPLALERETIRAGGFLRTMGRATSMPVPDRRTVAQVAAEHLSRLSGQVVVAKPPSAEDARDLAEKVGMALKNKRTMSPSSMPALDDAIRSTNSHP